MKHAIKNQYNKYLDGEIYAAVKNMLTDCQEQVIFQDIEIKLISDFRKSDGRETVVEVRRYDK